MSTSESVEQKNRMISTVGDGFCGAAFSGADIARKRGKLALSGRGGGDIPMGKSPPLGFVPGESLGFFVIQPCRCW